MNYLFETVTNLMSKRSKKKKISNDNCHKGRSYLGVNPNKARIFNLTPSLPLSRI